ncbi:hypothetical protein NHX12_003582 [Muraenolepis orangiensis]|uniref:RIB43A-like with coiled-coils protein 2 n=1 Tax=Muraenolepis orangiensis TaxID=630683 RepID=A0A9Q0E340_9TELE|nr:hypothetical protein NHX12_003582 [Muraenolepis orangiensis]
MFNIEMVSDRIAAAHLGTHRNRELQRKERIFDAKVRTIGVDQIALQHQVKENKEKVESEKDSLNAFAADMVRNDKAACILESRKLKEGRILERTLDDYRHCYQQSRDCDLEDPRHLQAPGGTAGLQMTLPDEHYNQSRINMDSKALQLQEAEQATKTALAHATKDYNLAKAAEDRGRHQQTRERTELDKRQADVLDHLQADGELEASQNTALQAVTQLNHFNLHQVEQKRRTQQDMQREEEQQERIRLDSARSALLLERQQRRADRTQRRELDLTNAQLAQAQRQQKKALEKKSSGGFDDSYFSRFNTSSR